MNSKRACWLILGAMTFGCSDVADEVVAEGGSTATGGTGGTTSSGGGGTGGTTSSGGGGTGGVNTGGGGSGGGAPAQCSLPCHGSADNAAPPQDIFGNSDTSEVTVGAHQAHVLASDWHRDPQCEDCHLVPTLPEPDPSVPTHLNGAYDLVWGALPGPSASFDAGTATCTVIYCHGTTLMADRPGVTTVREPVWTTVDGSQATCGASCHSTPPGGFHPAGQACESCHADTITSFTAGDPPTATWTDADLHINGEVNTNGGMTCTMCHGDQATGNPAPPRGTANEMQTTDPAVGAHTVHLTSTDWHRTVLCDDCHVIPQTILHPNSTTDFDWSGIASNDGASPAYDTGTFTCSGVYCHGTTLFGPNGGGSVSRQPVWNVVDGTYDACGSTCHTNPPGDAHPAFDFCSGCHSSVVTSYTAGNPPTVVWADSTLHINGTVDF